MGLNGNYVSALWHSKVLPGGLHRHSPLVAQVMSGIQASRRNLCGITAKLLLEEEAAAAWLIEALCQGQAHLPPVPLALPRTRGAYTATAKHRAPFGYNAMTRVLSEFKRLGWCVITTGAVGRGYSRIAPSGVLLDHCRRLVHAWMLRPARTRSELMVMGHKTGGRKAKRMLRDDEHPDLSVWRDNLDRINGFLVQQCIQLRATDVQLREFAIGIAERQVEKSKYRKTRLRSVHYGQVSLYRSFSERLDLGGRFYGGWWQNVPRELRRFIWINEWQGAECDFSGMSIRCLYARDGLVMPEDPYDIGLKYASKDDPRREIVKEFINSVLNDKKRKYKVGRQELHVLKLTSRELHGRVMEVHKPIAHYFHTDAGLQMQFIDSQIAERVTLKMMEMGAVCLPIHDSFIVQAPFLAQLVSVMESSFAEVTGGQAQWKGVDPAVIEHYSDVRLSDAEVSEKTALRGRLARELDRFSIANEYFFTWAAQMWGNTGWATAMRKLDAVPQFLQHHHAFPLQLLRRG